MNKEELIEILKQYKDSQQETDYQYLEENSIVEQKLQGLSKEQIEKSIKFFYKFIKTSCIDYTARKFTTIPNAVIIKNIIDIYAIK